MISNSGSNENGKVYGGKAGEKSAPLPPDTHTPDATGMKIETRIKNLPPESTDVFDAYIHLCRELTTDSMHR